MSYYFYTIQDQQIKLGRAEYFSNNLGLQFYNKFKSACEQARQFTKRPPQNDILELYSLYKQANVGDINTSKPLTSEGKAKWEAWNSKKGMNGKTAKEHYIAKVKSLLGTCA